VARHRLRSKLTEDEQQAGLAEPDGVHASWWFVLRHLLLVGILPVVIFTVVQHRRSDRVAFLVAAISPVAEMVWSRVERRRLGVTAPTVTALLVVAAILDLGRQAFDYRQSAIIGVLAVASWLTLLRPPVAAARVLRFMSAAKLPSWLEWLRPPVRSLSASRDLRRITVAWSVTLTLLAVAQATIAALQPPWRLAWVWGLDVVVIGVMAWRTLRSLSVYD